MQTVYKITTFQDDGSTEHEFATIEEARAVKEQGNCSGITKVVTVPEGAQIFKGVE